MLKLRLKRGGRKRQPAYRIIVVDSRIRREGKQIETLGFYKPISKEFMVNKKKVRIRLAQGVQPTDTVKNLLIKAGIVAF